jgi:hypothetical protein
MKILIEIKMVDGHKITPMSQTRTYYDQLITGIEKAVKMDKKFIYVFDTYKTLIFVNIENIQTIKFYNK